MERTDLKEKKELELTNVIAKGLEKMDCEYAEKEAERLLHELLNSGCIQISAPKEDFMMHCLRIDALNSYNSGESIKPGNIFLNIRKLINTIPNIIGFGVSATYDITILKVCSVLNLWINMRNIMTVKINKEQAIVIIALWKNCNYEHKIELVNGHICTNNLMQVLGEDNISWKKYNLIIDQLVQIHCIELEEGIIWLREWISKKYI